ncbi:DUF2680 domain-containing protein [Brevibacillus fulvus]|uniref:Polyhydroxyalkanoate synthesis regulator phasin n=1 Tax=Brevibacillus fulvus TaxID=1125967 RepID=A0A938XWF7_9BACL|nr:DUF2680 domain-containing protein [Brevibacillus fulvus]MBM7591427.1 polyhydroxyalkanoate synthesis regulator phasin [Brevibacillus fulvus]
MFSKARVGLLMGALATVLSVGGFASVYAATDSSQSNTTAPAPHFKGGFALQKGGNWNNEELLSLLDLKAEDLQAAFKEGKTLAEIAEAQGVAEDKVIDLLVEQEESRLDEAIKAGKLTAEQADSMKDGIEERVKNMVENTHQPGMGRGFGRFDSEELLSLLDLKAEDLQAAFKEGKTLAEIAEAQGVAEDKVIDLLVEQEESRLDEAVKAGKLTAEQADSMKDGIEERVKNMVENGMKRPAMEKKSE